ncbi:MAG: acetyl-CoA carboxylase carboxyltransferase subunit alpha [Proteobacteria bacterium]|nr:acetyl-CoA carboxylase carboxyltransferase subunit alpha [Pseudomonadota bacterium]MDA1133055.1 acetyl-CoA carboxylase carboxyltransferase subunit alpha [Pseudomonadota bacterium]
MPTATFLEFEKPIAELEGKIKELRHLADGGDVDIADEVTRLQSRADQLLNETYAQLSPWQKTQVARHLDRPHFSQYVQGLITDFTPLAGDRVYGEDLAIVGGPGRFRDRSVMVIGHEKGVGTDGRIRHNFGMAHPEGYRKAGRLMKMADHFGLPILCLVDTQGAYPGVGAEQRGQAEAIARTIQTGLDVRVPVVCVIVGEGGSGGAVALAIGNRVMMLEHSIYSVISPEGCAAILWRSSDRARDAAEALKLTAQDLMKLRVIDRVISEPTGGAQRHPQEMVRRVGAAVADAFTELDREGDHREARRQKFLGMGKVGLA